MLRSMATTLGSLSTTPSPVIATSVFAVPRSIAKSTEEAPPKPPVNLLKKSINDIESVLFRFVFSTCDKRVDNIEHREYTSLVFYHAKEQCSPQEKDAHNSIMQGTHYIPRRSAQRTKRLRPKMPTAPQGANKTMAGLTNESPRNSSHQSPARLAQ